MVCGLDVVAGICGWRVGSFFIETMRTLVVDLWKIIWLSVGLNKKEVKKVKSD